MPNTVGGSINFLRPYINEELIESFDGDIECLRNAILALVEENLKPLEEQTNDFGALDGKNRKLGVAISWETNRVFGVHNGNIEKSRQDLTQAVNSLLSM